MSRANEELLRGDIHPDTRPDPFAPLSTREWERTQFVYCYAWGHAWDEYDGSGWRPQIGSYFLVLRCVRCATERRESYDIHGDLAQRFYDYPAGYKYGRGESKPSKSDFRLLALSKLRQSSKRNTVTSLPQRRKRK